MALAPQSAAAAPPPAQAGRASSGVRCCREALPGCLDSVPACTHAPPGGQDSLTASAVRAADKPAAGAGLVSERQASCRAGGRAPRGPGISRQARHGGGGLDTCRPAGQAQAARAGGGAVHRVASPALPVLARQALARGLNRPACTQEELRLVSGGPVRPPAGQAAAAGQPQVGHPQGRACRAAPHALQP